jgi:hypothetical protein
MLLSLPDVDMACDCAQVIKRFIMHAKKTAFIVEHDFIMAAYLADRVIVYEGTPSKDATARQPQSLLSGESAGPAHNIISTGDPSLIHANVHPYPLFYMEDVV